MTLDDWKKRVEDARDVELLALRDSDYLGLEDLDDDSKQWAIVVKEEILRRGL